MSHKIAVEVVYALPEKQYLQRVTLEEGATVEAAIRASGILELRSDIDLAKNKVGIYSRPVKLGDVLKEGLIEHLFAFLTPDYLVRAGLLSMLVKTPALLKVNVRVCWVTSSWPGC